MTASGRYTSPDLSRRLRDAGLSQDDAPDARYWRPAQKGHEAQLMEPQAGSFRPDGTNTDRGPAWYRALRLDEVLEELTREREGGRLALWVDVRCSLPPLRLVDAPDWMCEAGCDGASRDDTVREADTPAEAAGLVLLALMEARK